MKNKLVLKKNYVETLDSLKKALPIMITFKNKENTLAILLSRFMLVVET
jgi:RNAse (barnase) inhibitor barstar